MNLITIKVLFNVLRVKFSLPCDSIHLAVDKVIKCGQLVYRKIKLEPERFQDASSSILLENIDKQKVEFLLLLYENEAKSGGGKIESHEYDELNKELVIQYKETSVAQRVLDFGPIDFLQDTYTATKYKPKTG